MPDPIRCSVDPGEARHTVTCEPALIGPDAAPETPSPTTLHEVPPLPAAVTALLKRFPATQHELHAPPVATATLGGAERCAGSILAMAPLMLGLGNTLLGVAGGFKVGFDLGTCLAKDALERQLDADRAAGVLECEGQGGVVYGEVGHSLICERRAPGVGP
jgi:hypothetical protein